MTTHNNSRSDEIRTKAAKLASGYARTTITSPEHSERLRKQHHELAIAGTKQSNVEAHFANIHLTATRAHIQAGNNTRAQISVHAAARSIHNLSCHANYCHQHALLAARFGDPAETHKLADKNLDQLDALHENLLEVTNLQSKT